jgi:hypothetical protein
MSTWSKSKELRSRIDKEINENGFITREKMIELYECVYADECNKLMNQCGGRNQAYHSLISQRVKKYRNNMKDLITLNDDGEEYRIRRWGYDPTIDAYVFQCKLAKDDDQIGHAVNANSHKRKIAKAMDKSVMTDHKAIKEQAEKVEREERARRFWESQPMLFEPHEDGTYGAHHGF